MNVASAGNTGHFCNEIDLAGSEGLEGMTVVNIKTQKTFRWILFTCLHNELKGSLAVIMKQDIAKMSHSRGS